MEVLSSAASEKWSIEPGGIMGEHQGGGGGQTRREFISNSVAGAAAIALPLWLSGCAGPSASGIGAAPSNPTLAATRYFDEGFGLSQEALRKILAEALSSGGAWADVYAQHRISSTVGFEDNLVNEASRSVDLGVGIRVVRGDQTGYAFTEDLSLPSLLAAARTAASIASGGAGKAPATFTQRTLPAYYDTAYDWQRVGVDQIVPVLTRLNAEARADALVEKVSVTLSTEQNRILIVDSEGRASFDSQPLTRLRMSVTMNKDGERQSNSYNISARVGLEYYDEARIKSFVKENLDRTRILFEATQPQAGEMPVVLGAGSSGILLHEAIGHGMEADFNRKGISIFSDKIGKKVASEHVTIVDSGVDPRFQGSINVDDEGNLPQVTELVRDGVMTSYMHDRISAAHYGVEPTGSGRRQSFRHAPMPRMRNTYMKPGPHTRDAIIASVKRGIFAQTFTNGQVKIGEGDYTFFVKNGFLIEDGRLTAPIKNVNIIGNGPESLSRITMVADDFAMDEVGWNCGKDGQSVPVSLGLPTVLVSSITVGGR